MSPSLLETKESQIAITRTMMLLLMPSRSNTVKLNNSDKTKLMLKRMLINGERDSPQAQAQLSKMPFNWKTLLIMITMPLIQVTLVIQSRSNTLKLRKIDGLPLKLKKLLMPGELDLPKAQELCTCK
jgi:hypothetical protein